MLWGWFMGTGSENGPYVDPERPLLRPIVIPRLQAGGCIVGHNVSQPRPGGGRSGMPGTAEYYEYMLSLKEFESYIHPQGRNGVAISCTKE